MYLSYLITVKYHLGGRITLTILEPSNGGIGIKLKMPSPTFMKSKDWIKYNVLENKLFTNELSVSGKKRANITQINEARNPKSIFDNGPHRAVIAKSRLGFLKLRAYIGTGLAQPK